MDILVMLGEDAEHSPMLAHVSSVPSPLGSRRPARDVVTLYGTPSAEALAMAVAAALESRRLAEGGGTAIRHIGVWPERGAVGDAAWRDHLSGELHTHDIDIPLDVLHGAAGQLLDECGSTLRQLVAGLLMSDWPEGTRRAISFSLAEVGAPPAGAAGGTSIAAHARGDAWLERFREADGFALDGDDE